MTSTTDGTSRRTGDSWREVLERVGVPERHQEAYWDSCDIYEEDDDKQGAYFAARSFAGKDNTEAGSVMQDGIERFSIFLMGDYGTGKTWLATAVFKHLLWNRENKSAIWSKFYDFVREVQSTYSAAATDTVRTVLKRYQNTPILLLDDVGDLTVDEQTDDRRRLLYEVLDKRNDKMLPTILTSNLSPGRFKAQFGERTLERVIEMAAMYRMDGRNYRKEPIQ